MTTTRPSRVPTATDGLRELADTNIVGNFRVKDAGKALIGLAIATAIAIPLYLTAAGNSVDTQTSTDVLKTATALAPPTDQLTADTINYTIDGERAGSDTVTIVFMDARTLTPIHETRAPKDPATHLQVEAQNTTGSFIVKGWNKEGRQYTTADTARTLHVEPGTIPTEDQFDQ